MRASLLFIFVVPVMTLASISSSTSNFVIAFSGEKTTAVSLEKEADYVSIAVEIQSEQKDPVEQINEIREIQGSIIEKANEQEQIEIHKGPISLSASPVKSGFAVSSGYYRSKTSTAQIHILARLDAKNDIYDCAIQIRRFLDSVKLPSKAKFSLGEIQLTVKNPEQYRAEILKKIGEDAEFVKSALGFNGTILLAGLDQPVLVRQVDDRKVELFIDYSMSIELSGSR